jgi:excisionase family DNA binding protein
MAEVGGTQAPETSQARRESGQLARAAQPELRTGERPAPESAPDALWDVGCVAAYLHLSVHAIYRMTAKKAGVRIPHIRLGSKLRFRRVDVDRWLSLLTVSNLDVLQRMRDKAKEVTRGNHSQEGSGLR